MAQVSVSKRYRSSLCGVLLNPGVIDAQSGYANGTGEQDANYSAVCAGDTGFRETVRVEYDPEQVSLDALLLAYFYVIDPTVQNRQGNDIGTQYQTGIYYTNDAAKETVERIAELERSRNAKFYVEIGPLLNYYPAVREKFGQTIVMVTHDERLAEMADRKIVMSDGAIL